MKRIFTAIDVPESERIRISTLMQRLQNEFPEARVKWERAEKLHLTLKFFGDASDEQLAKITEAVEETARQIRPFDLQFSGAGGAFPSARNARVLWLAIEDETENLRALNERLETECEKRGFAREKRDFKPHLTIARFKQKADDVLLKEFLRTCEPPLPPFAVSEITIYASELLPHGSRYHVISKTSLAAS